MCNRAFSDEIKWYIKYIFIDDMSSDLDNRDSLITKLYTEGRHSYI